MPVFFVCFRFSSQRHRRDDCSESQASAVFHLTQQRTEEIRKKERKKQTLLMELHCFRFSASL
jgi:hypothetical protein